MSNVARIAVMGRTGIGKSTLINSVLGYKAAEVGKGGAITQENKTYKTFRNVSRKDYDLSLYDTVGLELDQEKNKNTFREVRKHLEESIDRSEENDINVVWFCVNSDGSRFEDYEIKNIDLIMHEYEIPFIIVLTKSFDEDAAKSMKNYVLSTLPNVTVINVLAEDKKTNAVTIPAFGVDELLETTVDDFNLMKIALLERKSQLLEQKIRLSSTELNRMKKRAYEVIDHESNVAFGLGCAPLVSLFSLQPQYINVINGINQVYGISFSEDNGVDIAAMIIGSIITVPLFIIPGLAGKLAKELVQDKGNEYLESVHTVVSDSSVYDLKNSKLMFERVKEELNRRKNRKRYSK